jgi:subtilase family serine protease
MNNNHIAKYNTSIGWTALLLVASFELGLSLPSFGQQIVANRFPVLTPESSIKRAEDAGVKEHTHLRVLLVDNASAAESASFNTPASIRSAYSLPSTGGSNAIAIVDAYDYPTALSDFNTFSKEFSLPQETSTSATGGSSGSGGSSGPGGGTPPRLPFPFGGGPFDSRWNHAFGFARGVSSSAKETTYATTTTTTTTNTVFQVVYATGQKPQSGGNTISSWNLEAALDIEWAHALAPSAKIYLVEAASDSNADLMYAVKVASSISGVKEISMSWGGSETETEANYDSYFQTSGIVYVASSGDTSAETEYPAVSPYVVAAGGTTLNRDSSGNFLSETAWSDTGCGPSTYESRPIYQNAIYSIVGSKRGTADISFDANPNTGVNVYDSTPYEGEEGWWVLGGTSVAAPCLAGVINLAASSNGFATGTTAEQSRIYSYLNNSSAFRDITSGSDGAYKCAAGWDYVTGVGSPIGLTGK